MMSKNYNDKNVQETLAPLFDILGNIDGYLVINHNEQRFIIEKDSDLEPISGKQLVLLDPVDDVPLPEEPVDVEDSDEEDVFPAENRPSPPPVRVKFEPLTGNPGDLPPELQ